MPKETRSAPRFEGAQIEGGRVVDFSRSGQRAGIAFEVEGECIGIRSYLFICEVFYVLTGKSDVGKTRRYAGTWRAKIVPPRPHSLCPRQVRERGEHFSLGL